MFVFTECNERYEAQADHTLADKANFVPTYAHSLTLSYSYHCLEHGGG